MSETTLALGDGFEEMAVNMLDTIAKMKSTFPVDRRWLPMILQVEIITKELNASFISADHLKKMLLAIDCEGLATGLMIDGFNVVAMSAKRAALRTHIARGRHYHAIRDSAENDPQWNVLALQLTEALREESRCFDKYYGQDDAQSLTSKSNLGHHLFICDALASGEALCSAAAN